MLILLIEICLYYDRKDQNLQEAKLERERGWDRERSSSRDSNLGRPYRKAVGADKITPFDSRELMKNYIYNYIIVLNL